MGKSSSKMSSDMLEKFKPPSSVSNSVSTNSLIEAELINWYVFYQEVEVSDCMQTLFRGNCLASRVMSNCFRTFGAKYLKQVLEPHIRPLTLYADINESDRKILALSSPTRVSKQPKDATAIIENNNNNNNNSITIAQQINGSPLGKTSIKKGTNLTSSTSIPPTSISYEIDSARLEENGDIDENQRNLLKLTKQILDSILSSAEEFPDQLKSMCTCLRQVLSRKYPNSNANLRAVGTVIFLRFINPAIISPFEAGIVDRQPHPKIMRGLMLVSKILQNIANDVEFSKEQHMLPFNDFVREQFEPMKRWVSEISSGQNHTEDNQRIKHF